MSDSDKSGPTGGDATVKFTEREQQLLCWAMQSLKSGAPEIDYDNLAKLAGMSNPRSASNAWAKIKVKLADGAANGAAPATPSKGRPKKKAVNDDAECSPTPTKTPRKRAAKKQDVDGEESPKKKGGRPKKPTNVKAEVKDEPQEEEEYFDSSASPIKATSEEDAEGEEEEEEI